MWPVRRFWGQIYAQADEHKEDIYADKRCNADISDEISNNCAGTKIESFDKLMHLPKS